MPLKMELYQSKWKGANQNGLKTYLTKVTEQQYNKIKIQRKKTVLNSFIFKLEKGKEIRSVLLCDHSLSYIWKNVAILIERGTFST